MQEEKYFTDNEYRILLAAISRERDVCKKVDTAISGGIPLVPIVDSIERKIKKLQEKEAEKGKKLYKIPVTWTMVGYIEVMASSPEEAIRLAEEEGVNCPLPDNGEYLEDSFEINEESKIIEVRRNDYVL